MLYDPKNDPILPTKRFVAQVIVITSPIKIKAGYSPVMYCNAAYVRVHISGIIAKLDKKGQVTQADPEFIKQGDTALIEVEPEKPIYVDNFSQYAAFGRIILYERSDRKCTNLIVGVVKDVTHEIEDEFNL